MKYLVLVMVIIVSVISFYWLWSKEAKKEVVAVITRTDFKIVAAGDIACSNLTPLESACQQEATAKLIEQLNPEFVLVLGDIQYGGATLENYLNYYDKSWGRLKSKTRPAIGNHEFEGDATASGYFDYFNGIEQAHGVAGERGKGYYSFEKNGWKFYVLNTNCGEAGGCNPESPQGRWLEQQLTADTAKCQIAYFHQPLFSSGLHGPIAMVRPIWQILYKYNVDIVLNGHDHLYERFAPQDPYGKLDQTKGIREFVVGTGGRNLYQVTKVMPNSESRIVNTFGVLELDLRDSAYSWQFITTGNDIKDAGSASCI